MVMGTINNGVASFKGIPFAAPPIGPLRWKPPQPVISWDGIKRTDSFGLPCAQKPGHEIQRSEDCLFLNVWSGATNPAERRPVMVWIYGGGVQLGSDVVPNSSTEVALQSKELFGPRAAKCRRLTPPKIVSVYPYT